MFLIFTILFFLILLDPFGAFGLKLPIIFFFITYFLITQRNNLLKTELVFIALGLIIFSLIFALKQELILSFNEVSQIVSQTVLFFALFLIIYTRSFYIDCLYQAIKILLVVNLAFLGLGAFFPQEAIGANLLLTDYRMFSLEMRSHYITDYSFYHNSIYAAIVYFPRLVYDLRRYKFFTIKFCVCFLCILFHGVVGTSVGTNPAPPRPQPFPSPPASPPTPLFSQ